MSFIVCPRQNFTNSNGHFHCFCWLDLFRRPAFVSVGTTSEKVGVPVPKLRVSLVYSVDYMSRDSVAGEGMGN